MSTSPAHYGTRALGKAVGVSDKTALRFLWTHPHFQKLKHEPRSWRRLDADQFELAVVELKKLQETQPNHPLRALKQGSQK